jgi:hypothetical protein
VRLSDEKKEVNDDGLVSLIYLMENWDKKNIFPGISTFLRPFS